MIGKEQTNTKPIVPKNSLIAISMATFLFQYTASK